MVGDQHCLRSTGVCLKRWRSVLRETKNLKVNLFLIHFLNLLFGFKRGAVHVGWKRRKHSPTRAQKGPEQRPPLT